MAQFEPSCASAKTAMNRAIFRPDIAGALRRHIVRNTPEYESPSTIPDDVTVAVVNAADRCPLSCPHCMYAAPVVRKRYPAGAPRLADSQTERFVSLMNEAGAEHLVLTGGGESYDNLPAMTAMLRGMTNLRQVVTVTSGYFATSAEEAGAVLGTLVDAIKTGNVMHRRERVEFILRLSVDTFHRVALSTIAHAVRQAQGLTGTAVHFRPVVRTILDASENLDVALARELGAELLPAKDPSDPSKGIPIIDGFPTRWLCTSKWQIPVIYKPVYFEGLAHRRRSITVPGTSWLDIKTFEEEHGLMFNLSLRGPRGEGHNYYQTVLLGHSHWRDRLGEVRCYNTPKRQEDKGLCVYLPADGRLFVNASAPDSHIPVNLVPTWRGYRETMLRDVLQASAVSMPTADLVELAAEVRETIHQELKQHNFVFAAARLAMETAPLRLYLTIRLLQMEASKGLRFADPIVAGVLALKESELQAACRAEMRPSAHSSSEDPIIGNEASVWAQDDVNDLLTAEIARLASVNWG